MSFRQSRQIAQVGTLEFVQFIEQRFEFAQAACPDLAYGRDALGDGDGAIFINLDSLEELRMSACLFHADFNNAFKGPRLPRQTAPGGDFVAVGIVAQFIKVIDAGDFVNGQAGD